MNPCLPGSRAQAFPTNHPAYRPSSLALHPPSFQATQLFATMLPFSPWLLGSSELNDARCTFIIGICISFLLDQFLSSIHPPWSFLDSFHLCCCFGRSLKSFGKDHRLQIKLRLFLCKLQENSYPPVSEYRDPFLPLPSTPQSRS